MHDPGAAVDSPVRVPCAAMGLPTVIEGPAPDGSIVRIDLACGRRVVWFLTSSCKPCRAVWPVLIEGDVVVTPSPSTESRRKVAGLAPAGVSVVMSSEAWFAFRPGPAPWRMVVADGEVLESGSAQPGPQGVDGSHYG